MSWQQIKGSNPWGFLTYLANRITAGERLLPYSTVSAVDFSNTEGQSVLFTNSGERLKQLEKGQIALNSWAAKRLAVSPGDSLTMYYYEVGASDSLLETRASFVVAAIVEMRGLGADPTLAPTYPGIGDAKHIRDWDPPFAMNLDLITPEDEAYWDQWRGTPKAFISLSEGQDIWESRFGNLTALRFPAHPGFDPAVFKSDILREVSPATLGMVFLPLKREGLQGAVGATDFSGLFIGFSFFLIIAASILIALLFRLGVEQRGRELGIYLSSGYSIKKILRNFLAEGAVLTFVGRNAGTPGRYRLCCFDGKRTHHLMGGCCRNN